MDDRKLGLELNVSAIGLGCMGMSEFYGQRDDEAALKVMEKACELGVTMLDTADIYGMGHNEELIGKFISLRKPKIKIATKFGLVRKAGEYRRTIDNSPEYARKSCETSLKRLGVERIDLYYVHRIDQTVSIEETMQGLVALKQEGKIANIGLSEVSAETLRRAHKIHPIAAVQSEFSLWTREIKAEVMPVCRELGVGIVAYSPLGRGFLTGRFQNKNEFLPNDFREKLPRFQPENISVNRSFVTLLTEFAHFRGATPSQIALAWLLAQGEDIVPIPGTNSIRHLESNIAAAAITLTADELNRLSAEISKMPVAGERYTAEGMPGLNS